MYFEHFYCVRKNEDVSYNNKEILFCREIFKAGNVLQIAVELNLLIYVDDNID